MPRPKQAQKAGPSKAQSSPDEDEEIPATQTMTQAEKAASNISQTDMDRLVNDLVQYLLLMGQKRIAIKRQEINKHVLKENSRSFLVCVQKAEAKLKDVFGIQLVELEGSKQKSYILVNCLDNDTDKPHLEWSEEDNCKMGLVMVVLSLVFMNGNIIQDTNLYHTLKKLGVDIERNHEVFGDVKKLLTQEFVRQGYIDYVRQPTADPPAYEYSWGPRAKLETSRRRVLDFVCQIYGMEAKQWTSQWADVLRSEGLAPGAAQGESDN